MKYLVQWYLNDRCEWSGYFSDLEQAKYYAQRWSKGTGVSESLVWDDANGDEPIALFVNGEERPYYVD